MLRCGQIEFNNDELDKIQKLENSTVFKKFRDPAGDAWSYTFNCKNENKYLKSSLTAQAFVNNDVCSGCLLYTSPSPRD